MDNVVRLDTFQLMPNDFREPGYYIIVKDVVKNESSFLNTVVVVRESLNKKNLSRVIVNRDIYEIVDEGDIVSITASGRLRVILAKKEEHNTLLVTERCDNLCQFCSQPPRTVNDSHLYVMAALAINAFENEVDIGISGGEPLIDFENFSRMIDIIQPYFKKKSLHVLTNGRAFSNLEIANKVSDFSKMINLRFGIPIYAADSNIHDELVGAKGAFQETVMGLINIGNLGVPIEIRVIPTSKNIEELKSIIEMVSRVFSSVFQISIMNLESQGWARKNWESLYVSPLSYLTELEEAINVARLSGVNVSLFNYPLCHLKENIRIYAEQSISNWKNVYKDECNGCSLKKSCCGFFSSANGRFYEKGVRQ